MSTILKALRRLEDEKKAAADANLRNSVIVEPRKQPRPKRAAVRRVALPALALLLLFAGGAWWFTASVSPVPEASPQRSAPLARGDAGPEGVAPAASPSALPRVAGSPAATPPSPTAERRRVAAPPNSGIEEVASAEPRASAFAASEAASDPDREVMARALAPPPAEREPAEEIRYAPETGPAEIIETRSVREARLVAELRVSVASTIWHPRPDRRRAHLLLPGTVDPIELREGESVNGMRVVEIEPDGVKFERAGLMIRQRVGEGR